MKKYLILTTLLLFVLMGGCTQTGPEPTATPDASPDASAEATPSPEVTPSSDAKPSTTATPKPNSNQVTFIDVAMQAQPLAKKLAVDETKPKVYISHEERQLKISWSLTPELRKKFPEFSMLKVWLIDEAKGKKGSSNSDADEQYGPNLLEGISGTMNDEIPFSQAIGALIQKRDDDGKVINESSPYQLELKPDFELTPYDRVMITLETNANREDTNTRPGTPLWIGTVDSSKTVKLDPVPGGLIVFYFDYEITAMQPTDLATKLNIVPESINAKIQQNKGILWLNLYFKDQYPLPKGSVMEAWLVDTNSNDPHNTAEGPAFGDQALSDKINKAPQAIDLGRLLLQPEQVDGNYVYTVILNTKLPLTSFDTMHITLETDGSTGNYDPRPGNELFSYDLTARDAASEIEVLGQ